MKKLQIENSYIKAYKPLFDLYPDLTKFPVYSWGRHYKYECAGSGFEYSGEYGGWKKIAITCTKVNYLNGKTTVENCFNDNEIALIEMIDKKENVKGGKLYSGEIGDFLPDRSDVVRAYNFDDRAGNCLVIKKENDTFTIECVDCDSPE